MFGLWAEIRWMGVEATGLSGLESWEGWGQMEEGIEVRDGVGEVSGEGLRRALI